jgi:hypothetical protein
MGDRFVALISEFYCSFDDVASKGSAVTDALSLYVLQVSVNPQLAVVAFPVIRAIGKVMCSPEGNIFRQGPNKLVESLKIYLSEQLRALNSDLSRHLISLIFQILADTLSRFGMLIGVISFRSLLTIVELRNFPIRDFVELAPSLLAKLTSTDSIQEMPDYDAPQRLLDQQLPRSRALQSQMSKFRWDSVGHELVYQSTKGTQRRIWRKENFGVSYRV